jgi:hypothetical protein
MSGKEGRILESRHLENDKDSQKIKITKLNSDLVASNVS